MVIDALVLDGTVTLVALAILGLELASLLFLVQKSGTRRLLVANGLSGVFLILALRSALLGPNASAIALWLSLGFLAHLADLILRLRR